MQHATVFIYNNLLGTHRETHKYINTKNLIGYLYLLCVVKKTTVPK